MGAPGQQQQPERMTLDQKIEMGVGFANFIEPVAEAWLHQPGTFGSHHTGFHAVVSTIAMYFVVANYNPVHASLAFIATLAVFFIHRVGRLLWGNPTEHSRYAGMPWLCVLGLDEVQCKRVYEPALCIGLGCFTLGVSEGIGVWLIASGFALGLSSAYMKARDDAFDRTRKDQMALQRFYRGRWEESAYVAPQRRNRKPIILLALTIIAGVGWLIYSGRVELPRFPPQARNPGPYDAWKLNRSDTHVLERKSWISKRESDESSRQRTPASPSSRRRRLKRNPPSRADSDQSAGTSKSA